MEDTNTLFCEGKYDKCYSISSNQLRRAESRANANTSKELPMLLPQRLKFVLI